MTVLFYTLGCKVNQYDTQTLKELFLRAGYSLAKQGETPDVVVINSCTVTAESDRKGRQAVGRFGKKYPNAIIAVTGCMPQAVAEKARALTGAHVVTGNACNPLLPQMIQQYKATGKRVVQVVPHEQRQDVNLPSTQSFEGRTRCFVKIQDGCDRFCSYCLIPYARGPIRSKSMADIREELTGLAQNGYKEAVLAGINLTAYQGENGEDLGDVVQMAQTVPGLLRIRLGSMEPDWFTPAMMEKIGACPSLCPQFHLSLQSGSDTVLQRMNRHYNTDFYRDLVKRLRERFPGCAITTDIMCGFPGETQEEFQQTLDFVNEMGFAKVHTFVYSPREGTPAAARKDQVSGQVKKQRAKALGEAALASQQQFLLCQQGRVEPVLFEQKKPDGTWEGHTPRYVPVRVRCSRNLTGMILPVTITQIHNEWCSGELQ